MQINTATVSTNEKIVLANSIEVYQLYIWLKNISPMIWRRLLVKSDTSIANLHYFIQILMGWEDYNLNKFTIRGNSYGVYHIGGMSFLDDANEVYLGDFRFRINEKFFYEYNFFAPWIHEIRVEKRLPIDVKQLYPVCVAGKYAAPFETCSSPEAFMELEEKNTPFHIWGTGSIAA